MSEFETNGASASGRRHRLEADDEL